MSINQGLFTSTTDQWETPQWLFDEYNEKFNFNLDVCALPENAKCSRYFTPDADGLKQKWGGVLLDEPAVWKGNRQVGAKSIRGIAERGHGGLFNTFKD